MARIGIVYSTVDGHTLEICERLAQVFRKHRHAATLMELKSNIKIDLKPFDQIVIGASIRYGKHRPEVVQLINDNLQLIESRHAAFFSVNAVARKPEKNLPHNNPYVKKFFQSTRWQPTVTAVFGGKINYSMYRFWDKTMIRLIMWMTDGPTALESNVDFTDWAEVEAFGQVISKLTAAGK